MPADYRGHWDYQIIDELRPAQHELAVKKSRYDGFAETGLDPVLRTRPARANGSRPGVPASRWPRCSKQRTPRCQFIIFQTAALH